MRIVEKERKRKSFLKNTWKSTKRSLSLGAAGLAAGSVLAYLPAVSPTEHPSLHTSHFQTSQSLPDDSCAYLQPFVFSSASQDHAVAQACEQEEKHREIVIVDFYGLNEKQESQVSYWTKILLSSSAQPLSSQDGILDPTVVTIPASEKAKEELFKVNPLKIVKVIHAGRMSALIPNDCIPTPPVEDTASAVAFSTMPILSEKYPNATIIALSPQNDCTAPGLSYVGQADIATIDPGEIVHSGVTFAQSIASDVAHEYGHLRNLGHAGVVIFRIDRRTKNKEIIMLPHSTYKEYGEPSNVEGNWHGTKWVDDNIAIFDEVQDEILLWPEAILKGKKILHSIFVKKEWTSLPIAELNGYIDSLAMVPLEKPVQLQDANGDKVTFDTFVIFSLPQFNKGKLISYDSEYFLYDSQNTHNTSQSFNMTTGDNFNPNTLFSIHVDDQIIQLLGTQKGLAVRTFPQNDTHQKDNPHEVEAGSFPYAA